MDESENHHSQQTDTRTENQTHHVLTHRQVLSDENTWTQGREHHTLGSVGRGQRRHSSGWGGCGGIIWGEMPDISDGGIEATNYIAMYVPMEKSCMSAHVPQNVNYNKKKDKTNLTHIYKHN